MRDRSIGDVVDCKGGDPVWEVILFSRLGRFPVSEEKIRHKRAGKGGAALSLECIEPDAAGVDVGATEIYVAVPPDRDPTRFVVSVHSPKTCRV